MATVTNSFDFDYAFAPFGETKTAPAPRAGFWKRFYLAMLESRRMAAEREIRRHAAFLERIEGDLNKSDLPF